MLPRKRTFMMAALCITLCALFLAAGAVKAEPAGYSLSWWTIDSGGTTRSAGTSNYVLDGTVGQADAGASVGTSYRLTGGFWHAVGPQAGGENMIFLPVMTR